MPKSVMMNSEAYSKLEQHFRSNLPRYIKEHPGRYILLEQGTPVKESFFHTKVLGLDRAISRIDETYSTHTFYCDRIPSKMPEENKDLADCEVASWFP